MKSISRAQWWDYFILISRIWIALILAAYGIAKLTGNQFYTSPNLLSTPVKEANLFQLSWYLAEHEPFKSFIGISEILTAGLLVYKRTVVIGAFISIPILVNILIWDMSFMDPGMAIQFSERLSFYLVLILFILWSYRKRIGVGLQYILEGTTPKFKYPIWIYITLPIMGFGVEYLVGKGFNVINYLFYYFRKLF